MRILAERKEQDSELLIYVMTLINKVTQIISFTALSYVFSGFVLVLDISICVPIPEQVIAECFNMLGN